MNKHNYSVYTQVPSSRVQKEPIPAIYFLDDNGNPLYDEVTVQGRLNAKDKNYQQILAASRQKQDEQLRQKDKLLHQGISPAEKEELKAYGKAINRFDTVLYFVDQYGCPAICKTRHPGDKYVIQRRLTACRDFHAVLVKQYTVDGKVIHLIGISFKTSRGTTVQLLFQKEKFTAKAFYQSFTAAGGSCCYGEGGKMQADLLFGFLGSILDTEHTALLPPVGWFHLDDRWVYTPYKEDCCSDSLLSTPTSLVLIRIAAVLKTRIPDKFNGSKYLFAISENDATLQVRLTVDDIPKHFHQMLDQYSASALLPVYGDNPEITATIGDYRSKTNFVTLITRTKAEPRFPLCLIVSTNGITELQQKHCLFLPHEESHTAALPLAKIFSKLCALVEHNPDAFERIVERSYITALGSLDEECAFRNEIALLNVSSVVLCWALKLLKQPDLAQTAHEVCQAYINNCLSEWDSSLDCNAKEILRRVLYSAQEAGDIRLLRYGEVDSSYDPDRDIVQKGGDFLLKGSLLKYLICEYAQGYSASAIISHLQSEHLLSEFSTAKKIRIDNGTYVDARLLTLKRSCLTEYEDSD